MAEFDTITKVLIILGAAYPRYEMPEQTPQVYRALLSDIPDQLLIAAAQQHAATSKWFPMVSELREMALGLQARASGLVPAEEAWVQVQEAVKRYGYYGETIPVEEGGGWRVPSSLDDLTKRAVEGLGGWRTLCQSENPAADRAHFLKIYNGLVQHRHQGAALLPQVQQVVEALEERGSVPRLEGGG